jgi:hypothetical protein
MDRTSQPRWIGIANLARSITLLLPSFQISQVIRSAIELVAFRGTFGRMVKVVHQSNGDEEEGRASGLSSGRPNQLATSDQIQRV